VKTTCKLILVGVAALLLAAGCGRNTGDLSPSERQAFDSAPPDVKQIWEMAVAAGKTNDYVASLTLFNGLLSRGLSPEQKDAASKQMTAVNQRLFAAARKDDPAAKKAIEELRRNPPNRPH
jgi:hypothetical protein